MPNHNFVKRFLLVLAASLWLCQWARAAGEIQLGKITSGQELYYVLFSAAGEADAGEAWDGDSWETFVETNSAFFINMTEVGATGLYLGNLPSIGTKNIRWEILRDANGDTTHDYPGDPLLAEGGGQWVGTHFSDQRVATGVPNIAPGAPNGLFIAGTNAQTTVTGGFGADTIAANSIADSAIHVAALAGGAIRQDVFATGSITADAIASGAITKGTEIVGFNDIAAVDVWNVDATSAQTQGTFGQTLGDSAADTDSLWSLANTNLNATVASRSILDQAGVRTAVGLATANLDMQFADLPTLPEFNARTLPSANYFDPAADTVSNVTNVAVLAGHTPQTGDSFLRLGAPAGASIAGDIALVEAQTDDIGAAGAGLSAIPSVGSVTNPVTVGTNNDKTGYTLTQAFPANFANLAITPATGLVSLAANQGTVTIGTVTTLTGHTPQTGDSFERLGAPAGVSVSADLALIESQTDDIGIAGAGLTDVAGTWEVAEQNQIRFRMGLDGTQATPTETEVGLFSASLLDNQGVGSIGEGIADAQSAGDPWATTLPGAYAPGTAGNIIGARIDAAVSSRLAPTSAGQTLNVSGGRADTNLTQWLGGVPNTLVSGRVDSRPGAMGTGVITSTTLQAGALLGQGVTLADATSAGLAKFATVDIGASAIFGSVIQQSQGSADPVAIRQEIDNNSTQLAAIVGDTNELQTDWFDGGRLDLILDSRASQASVDDLPTNAEFALRTILAGDYATSTALIAVDAVVDAIQLVTDKLNTGLELDGGFWRFTTNALEQAPTGSGGGGDPISPTWVDADHLWQFTTTSQITAPQQITEAVGSTNVLVGMDFTLPMPGQSSIDSINSVLVADEAGKTEPILLTAAVSTDKQRVHIPIDATSASPGTYTITVSITTTDSQTFTRRGVLILQ